MCLGQHHGFQQLESTEDQLEIHNGGNQLTDLSGWILTDDVVDQDYDPNAGGRLDRAENADRNC